MQFISFFAFVVSVSLFGANTVYLNDVNFPTPIKQEVSVTLEVDQIVEVAFLNEARIEKPVFVFDFDFGYGLEALPRLWVDRGNPKHFSYISEWICMKAGYNAPLRVSGSRSVIGTHVVEHGGSPREKSAKGPYLSHASQQTYPDTLFCSMK